MHACRALGDADYKDPKPFVSAEASVRRLDLLPEDKAVIIASDGLWDVIGDQDVVTMVDQLIKVCVVNESLPVVMHTSQLGCQVAHRICLYSILSKMCLCYTLCFGLQMHAYLPVLSHSSLSCQPLLFCVFLMPCKSRIIFVRVCSAGCVGR